MCESKTENMSIKRGQIQLGSVVNQNICEHMRKPAYQIHIHTERRQDKKEMKQHLKYAERAQTRMKCKTKCADENNVKMQAVERTAEQTTTDCSS